MLRLLVLAAAGVTLVSAQGLDYVKANYTKYEYRIPMRDGKRLFTSVYVPKDASKPYPILLNRTPYSVAPYGPDKYKSDIGPWSGFAKEGYIVVYQDVRGRYMSEGDFINMTPHKASKRAPQEIDESTDTYDTIDWLIKRIPNNNGKVGTWGISYPGFYTAAGMIDAHPAHALASPQAPITDWFAGDDFHRNGALYLPHAFNFLAAFGRPRPEPTEKTTPAFDHGTPDGYRFFLKMGSLVNANEKHFKNDVAFWNEIAKHPNYDAFWQTRNLRPHLKAIKPAVVTVGGWFDAENLYGALQVFNRVETQSPQTKNYLVMGPWFHGGWSRGDGSSLGDVKFNSKTSEWYREKFELPLFNAILKGKDDPKLKKATVFETGTNVWKSFDQWPPSAVQPKQLVLHAGGKLSFEPSKDEGFDEFLSDPSKPVPAVAGTAVGMTREHMVDDQRFASSRPDVLVYESDVLEEDITIAGPIVPSLTVSTTGTDADWIVKLVDVFPDNLDVPPPGEENRRTFTRDSRAVKLGGYQMLVRGEVLRGRFRDGLETPKAFEPGKATKVEYTMNDVFHTFRRGHRIMIQVQSTWFPLVDRNPQKFVPNIFEAKEADFQKAFHRVYQGRSIVKVGVLPQ